MRKIRIQIVEDHALLREGLRALFSSSPEFEIVAEAMDGREAVSQAKLVSPDVILMDLSLPNTNGSQAIYQIKQSIPSIRIIALTVHKTEEYVRMTMDAGADGYVLKDDSHQDLLAAIASVMQGKTYLSPGICDKVITRFLDQSGSTRVTNSMEKLTAREREITKLIAEGYKNREIAENLSISMKTVEKHRSNLMKKLGLHNISAITAYAIENGLVSLEQSLYNGPYDVYRRSGAG